MKCMYSDEPLKNVDIALIRKHVENYKTNYKNFFIDSKIFSELRDLKKIRYSTFYVIYYIVRGEEPGDRRV